MNISERSCQVDSASSVFERSGFQISARIRIFVCSGGCHDNNMTSRVSAARHKDEFGVQLQSVALSVFTLCGSLSLTFTIRLHFSGNYKTSECASIAEPSGRLSAKDVRMVHHDFIPRFLLFLVNC